MHQSNQLTKSCIDFLSFIFWSKNMIMIIVQTEINALRDIKSVNFDTRTTGSIQPLSKTKQEDCKQCE